PTVAGWIIQAGGMGGYGRNVNQMAGRAGGMAGSVAGATAGNMVGRVGKLLK
ncbi:conjugative transposon protein TraJ, partial [Bacteroides ovatus]